MMKGAILAFGLTCGFPLLASAQTYPSGVQADIKEAKTSCVPALKTLSKSFVTKRDVNGDGVPDYIEDYNYVKCNDGSTPFCGSRGCSLTVYASVRGQYKVIYFLTQDFKFSRVDGRPALIVTAPGDNDSCRKSPPDLCVATMVWNGETFKRVSAH